MKILALTLVALLSLLSTAALSQTPEALRNDILNFSHFSSDAGDAWGQDKSGAKQPADKNSDDPTKINLVTGQGDVSEVNYHPLNNHQRMKLWVNSSFTTPGAYFGSIGNALVDQAGGNPKEWGGGLKGYGRRVASRFGSNLVQGAVQSSFAAMLHEAQVAEILDETFAQAGVDTRVVLTAIDTDVIKTYVRAGLGVGIIASMAVDREQDADLGVLDGARLFPEKVTKLAWKRGAYLRGYVREFIDGFASGKALAHLKAIR